VIRLPRFGLRAKLVVALVGIAILTADLATLYSSFGLDTRVSHAAQTRLTSAAGHFAHVAATVYIQNAGWTRATTITLGHLAELDSLRVELLTSDGRRIVPPSPSRGGGPTAFADVMADGKFIAHLTIQPVNGQLLSPEEIQLEHELRHLHLVAGVIAAALAFVVALYLALTLSRPLRRIRAAAEQIQAGDLDARVDLAGDDEIHAVGRALNDLAETLQREEQLRKESVADLAHELRTPVMGLLARVEAAQDGVLDDEAANLQAMHAETMRLSHLLDDLSALSEAQRPAMLLKTETVNLAEVASRQAEATADLFEQKGIAFDVDLRSCFVAGDSGRLEQVLANLLSNSLRYTEGGGSVKLAVRGDGHSAVIEVSDTGIGIPPEDMGHIFTRFWRGEKSRSRATGGAGIGLAIVDELVRAHHGTISVTSTPGAGSTFVLTFPRIEPGLH
jgi:two-component system, OmpR family, sensor histidine kinase BaeS